MANSSDASRAKTYFYDKFNTEKVEFDLRHLDNLLILCLQTCGECGQGFQSRQTQTDKHLKLVAQQLYSDFN